MSIKNVEMRPAQCRAARALLDMTQTQLAALAGMGLSTVVDFERERRELSAAAVTAIQNALKRAGVEFTNGDQPGVRLTKAAAAQSRQPASASAAAEKAGRRKTPKVTDKKR